MKTQSSVKAMVESAILSAVSVVIILLSYYMPVFYLVGFIILPLPFAYIQIKHGIKYSLMALFVAGAISALIIEPFAALSMVILYGVLGIVLGYSSRNNENVFTTIILMSALLSISTVLIYKLSTFIVGVDSIKQMTDIINEVANKTKDTYSKMGIQNDTLKQMLDPKVLTTMIRTMLPSSLMIYSIISSYIVYKIAYKIFKRIGCTIKQAKPISQWFISRGLSLILFVLVAISYIIASKNGESGNIYLVSSFLIFTFAFSIQGISLISYFFEKNGMKIALRIIILFVIILSPINQMLLFVGMADYIIDFRKIGPMKKSLK